MEKRARHGGGVFPFPAEEPATAMKPRGSRPNPSKKRPDTAVKSTRIRLNNETDARKLSRPTPRTHEQPTIWEIPVKTRCDEPFIEPQFKYEIDGRRVFTFTEGAVHFKGLWRFYYGAADKFIGLAEIEGIETPLKPKPGTLALRGNRSLSSFATT